MPTDIRLRGIRLDVSVCGNDEEGEVNGRSSERRVPSPLGLSRVATEEDEVNLFSHYFSESENIGLLWAKVRMFCIESTDVCLKEVRCF